ncbi:MAG: alpha/beta hydrolase family esterase [Janthinobacterium lividum]
MKIKPFLLVGGPVLLAAAMAYRHFIYSPAPKKPRLSAPVQPGTIRVGERERHYRTFVPAQRPAKAPLVLVLHGSAMSSKAMRPYTGYVFDELADQHGFAVAYPDGYKGNWHDCRRDTTFPAKTENIDDMGFLRALVGRLCAEHDLDPARVFAFGYSNGGQMAFRLAVEEPRLVEAVAATGANLPVPEASTCAQDGPTARVLVVSGTKDPISPFGGGEVTIFGFHSRGFTISARATVEEFARRNGLTATPVTTALPHQRPADPTSVEAVVWAREDGMPVVAFYPVWGGGHVIPQPNFRAPRFLGATSGDLNLPEQAVRFFELLG